MERRPAALAEGRLDLLVVGGGVLGAFTAWRAAEWGLRVGLAEARDFGGGTTAGSGRVLHGGLRDLATLRLTSAARARREQAYLAGLAPRLVRPMGVQVSGTGHPLGEGLVAACAPLAWNGFRSLTAGESDLPRARRLAPDGAAVDARGFVYHEYQIRSPERLALAFVDAAHRAGAVVANYVEARELRTRSGRVTGIEARDRLDGRRLAIDADAVALTVGAWAPGLWSRWELPSPPASLARGVHVVLEAPEPDRARAAVAREDAPVGGGERRVFLYPWEGRVLAGATYDPLEGGPEGLRVEREEVDRLLRFCRRRFPAVAGIDTARPLYAYVGLYHEAGRDPSAGGRYRGGARTTLVDHAGPERGGVIGLCSAVVGRMTDVPRSSDGVLAAVGERLGHRSGTLPPRSVRPLERARPAPLDEPDRVEPDWLDDAGRIRELVERAVEEEAARSLTDLLFRRTWLGLLGRPGEAALGRVAEAMGDRLSWPPERRLAERERVGSRYAGLERARTEITRGDAG